MCVAQWWNTVLASASTKGKRGREREEGNTQKSHKLK